MPRANPALRLAAVTPAWNAAAPRPLRSAASIPCAYSRAMAVAIRHVQPSDYGRVIQHVNEWWGGRDMAPMLPRLFFIHFESTSFVADRDDGTLAGFLIGFLSQTDDETAYVHFVGVAPAERGSGLGRELYERFFHAARDNG